MAHTRQAQAVAGLMAFVLVAVALAVPPAAKRRDLDLAGQG
jgi:hypothetical protein